MRFISWNVNGLRAAVGKGFSEYFKEADADIFSLQETKLQAGQIDLETEGYHQYWNYAERKGYSGVAVFTKQEPLSVAYGIVDLAGQRGDEAVGHAVVEKAELHRIVAGKPELYGIIAVPDDSILGRVAAFEHLVGRGAFHAAQTGSLAQRAVVQGQRQRTGIEDFVRAAPDGITDLVSHLDFQAEVSAGRRRTDDLGRSGTGHSQRAAQCQKSFLHNIII